MAGTLFIVSTPIGNLKDITLRALEVLGEADLVVAEDTRTSRKLLAAHGIRTRLDSFHAHSSERKAESVVERLHAGENVAYVSDAGAPVVSDPGAELVARAHQEGIDVRVLPGASAVTAALAGAGLPCGSFLFLGFLPRTKGKRRAALAEGAASGAALVLFEAPTRARALIELLCEVVPHRNVALCRELTKLHEQILRGLPEELLGRLPDPIKGEVTIVVEAGPKETPTVEPRDIEDRARELSAQGLRTKEAADRLASELGIPRRDAYQAILEAQKNEDC